MKFYYLIHIVFCGFAQLLVAQNNVTIFEQRPGEIEVRNNRVFINGEKVKAGKFGDERVRILKFEDGEENALAELLDGERIEIAKGDLVYVVETERFASREIGGEYGFLGVGITDIKEGIVIASGEVGTPAYNAGLRTGDIMMSVNKIVSQNSSDFSQLIRSYAPGEIVEIELWPGGLINTVSVELGRNTSVPRGSTFFYPNSNLSLSRDRRNWTSGRFDKSLVEAAQLGIRVESDEGVVRVVSIKPGGSAEMAGVIVGDQIIQVDDMEIFSANKLYRVIKAYEVDDEIELILGRNQNEILKTARLQSDRAPVKYFDQRKTEFEYLVIFDRQDGRTAESEKSKPIQGFKLNSFDLSPNPTEGEIKVDLEMDDVPKGDFIYVRILSNEEKILREEKVENFAGRLTREFDLSDLEEGVYLFQLIKKDGEKFTRRFLIDKN